MKRLAAAFILLASASISFGQAVGGNGVPGAATSGSGTVTSVSVTTANGVSGTVATSTTTPAITLTLGTISPSSVTTTGDVNAGGNLNANGDVVQWGSNSTAYAPSSGILRLTNNATTSFTRLILGTLSTSFPALCISGVSLSVCDGTGGNAATLSSPVYIVSGTPPTITGCGTISAQHGGATAGDFTTTTTGTCAAAFALPTAPTGWHCDVTDITKHTAANIMLQSATSATGCTVTGTTAASDVLSFNATAY